MVRLVAAVHVSKLRAGVRGSINFQFWQKSRKMDGKMDSKISVIETWRKKYQKLYVAATRHPFIQSIRDGTVDLSSFKRWLEQDYIFVQAFETFLQGVLIKAQKETDESKGIEVISDGLAAIEEELSWFKKESAKWGVSLDNPIPQKANLDYCRFLEKLSGTEVEYPVALTALWAIETVYQDSFAHCLEDGTKTPKELKETCQRWGSHGFGQYCSSLQSIAAHQLEKASNDAVRKAEIAFVDVLQHEVEFWNMSHGST